MNILCVIDSLCFGGAQRQMVELALAFKEKGHQVSFLTYHHIPFFNHVVEDARISITCMEGQNYVRRLFRMRHFIRRGKYDAVLSFLEAANFISEFAGIPFRRWKLVVGERSANPVIPYILKLKLYRYFHFFADAVVANSYANMNLVRSANPMLPASKCHIIYNMVDVDHFRPPDHHPHRKGQRIRLVIAARIQLEKNIKGLINALSLMEKEDLDRIRIDWYGENDRLAESVRVHRESLKEIRAKGLEDHFIFHEADPDIVSIIQQSDAVGLFSFYEGFPNVICEAMACAKPVVCTKVSDMARFLSYDPGLLCDPTDAYSIKKALRHLIHMNQAQLEEIGARNREIALKHFLKEPIVSGYLQLLS